ncbi:MAG: hypothetical protein KAS64_11205 [Spirochaetes bacterium]|nr:hypothetical protein [Spirochaetota bacterium]
MKTAKKQIILITLMVSIIFFNLSSNNRPLAKKIGKMRNMQTLTLNSFEKPGEWSAKFSKHAVKIYDTANKKYIINKNKCAWRQFDGKPLGMIATNENKVFAVKASFYRKWYNWIEIIPKKPLRMEGRVKTIDFWVWGGNFNYHIEASLIDYKGFRHIIPIGKINHAGWRNFRFRVPSKIPQEENFIPKLKTLKFEKFIIQAELTARKKDFYVYFDRILYQTDMYIERFDGDGLVKQGRKAGWIPAQK